MARKNAKALWNTLKLEVGDFYDFRLDLIIDMKLRRFSNLPTLKLKLWR